MELQEEIDNLANDIENKTNRYFELLEIKEQYNS